MHRTAHALGMRTTATMMFGMRRNDRAADESLRDRAADPGRYGRLHGVYPVVLSARIYFSRAVSSRKKRRRSSICKMLAISRIYLDNILNIQSLLGDARTEDLPVGPALRRQ